jgi:hypothetical protein
MVHNVRSFNPINYGFKWTLIEGNEYGWYEFDSAEAHRLAKLECSEFVRNLKSCPEISNVHRHTLKNQLITRGGIGSGHPEISEFVTVYEVRYDETGI